MSRKSHMKQAGAVHWPEWMRAPSSETVGTGASMGAGGLAMGLGGLAAARRLNIGGHPQAALLSGLSAVGAIGGHQLFSNRGAIKGAIGRGWDSMGVPTAETVGTGASMGAGGLAMGLGGLAAARRLQLRSIPQAALVGGLGVAGALGGHQLFSNRQAIKGAIGRGVDSAGASLRERASELKAGKSPLASAGLAALALSAGGLAARQPGVLRGLKGLGYGVLPAASAITAGAMAQQHGFDPKAALKRWSGATGDFGDAALGSGILGMGALAATAGTGNWRSKLLGLGVAAPLLVAGAVRGVSAAKDAKKEYDIKAEKEWEELLAAVAKQPKHMDNPVNFAEFIKQNPGKAALGTLGVSALAYAAAGGNEGIARKIQAMRDNPGATAAGLGSLGVLSAATMSALKDNKKESA